jgi:hypothetical protein
MLSKSALFKIKQRTPQLKYGLGRHASKDFCRYIRLFLVAQRCCTTLLRTMLEEILGTYVLGVSVKAKIVNILHGLVYYEYANQSFCNH